MYGRSFISLKRQIESPYAPTWGFAMKVAFGCFFLYALNRASSAAFGSSKVGGMKSNVSGSYSIANFIALPKVSLWANTLISGYLLAILVGPELSHANTSSSAKLG